MGKKGMWKIKGKGEEKSKKEKSKGNSGKKEGGREEVDK